MELLETDDPVKGQLLKKASKHKENLEEEVNLITERAEKIITNALIVGGALALGYYLVHQFSDSRSKKKSKKKTRPAASTELEEEDYDDTSIPNPLVSALSQIGTSVANQATVFLLNLAKEKLSEYLQSQAEKKNS